MTISIESISFSHRPVPPGKTAALTIRKNERVDVTVPEWRNGISSQPDDSPAAYTISQILGNKITIKAQFRRRNSSDPTSVTVHAMRRGENPLGDVLPQRINFGSGVATFDLSNSDTSTRNRGVGISNIAWDWYADGAFLQTTRHRIYTLAGAPQPPWGQPGSTFAGFQVPWTEVLEHACLQANGARTADEAADRLTRWVNSLGDTKLQYDELSSGSSLFTVSSYRTFKCTRFLDHLRGSSGQRARVNCTDCATIVSTFANILGGNLVQSRIESRLSPEFRTNLIQKIGLSYRLSQFFRFHEVAWKFPLNGGGSASVYDPCLRFDGDSNLADGNFEPTLGVNKPLGVPGSEGYHFRVIAPTPAGTAAGEQSITRVQRKIDGQTTLRAATDPEQQRRLANEYDFESWQGTPTEVQEQNPHCAPNNQQAVMTSQKFVAQEQAPSPQPLVLNYSSSQDRFSPSAWKLREIDEFEAQPDPFKLTDAIWTGGDCFAAELRVLTYECSSIPAARQFLLSLLGEFEVPAIKRRRNFIVGKKEVEIGDVAFGDLDDLVLLFARANTVLFIQNAGRTAVPVSKFAHEIDTDITSYPDPKEKGLPEMKQFYVPEKKFRVGDDIHVQSQSGSLKKEQKTLFKFFAPSGQLFLKGDDLLYRPLSGGEQSITILGLKAGQKTVRQVLKLSVEQSLTVQEAPCKKPDKPDSKEERVMLDLGGSWSSIRPRSIGGSPADMNKDGFIVLESQNSDGRLRGSYVDMTNRTIETVTGNVTHVPPNSYRLVLRHPVGGGIIREYTGQLAAIEEGEYGVQLVVGRYTNLRDPDAPSDSAGVLDSQENGIWVATKP